MHGDCMSPIFAPIHPVLLNAKDQNKITWSRERKTLSLVRTKFKMFPECL